MTRSRSGSFLRNPWITLLWAIGICFMATEIVDGISGVTAKSDRRPPAGEQAAAAPDEQREVPAPSSPPPVPVPQEIVR